MPFKKYGRKKPYSTRRRRAPRRRFARKRFTKYSTSQKTVVRAPVNAREMYVKFPYSTIKEIASSGVIPSRYAVLANSLIPFPASYSSNTPTAGDVWAAGVSEYASQYNFYRVLGCSVSVQYVSESTTTTRLVMVPVTYGQGEDSVPDQPISDKISELDGLTYDELCSQPYAQSKLVGSNAGGPNVCYMKMFRKTKNMIGVKDLKDNEDTLINLPGAAGENGRIQTSGRSAYIFYLKMFTGGGTVVTSEVQFKIKYYVQLSGRNSWTPTAVPA